MSEQEDYGEPWSKDDGIIWSRRLDDGNRNLIGPLELPEHDDRAVACVNALSGVPSEAVEAGAVRELAEAARAVADAITETEDWGRLAAALVPFAAMKEQQ